MELKIVIQWILNGIYPLVSSAPWLAGKSPNWMEVFIRKSPTKMAHFPARHVWWNQRVDPISEVELFEPTIPEDDHYSMCLTHFFSLQSHGRVSFRLPRCSTQSSWISGIVTLWLFNIAMENGSFIDDFPIKTTISVVFSLILTNPRMTTAEQARTPWPNLVFLRSSRQDHTARWVLTRPGDNQDIPWVEKCL